MKRALKAARRLGRKRALLAAALLALVAGGAAVALAGGSEEGAGGESERGASAEGTGKVERRTLAEQLTAGGTIGYAGESTVLARLTGTVTALPSVGDKVEHGEQLYALAGEPVLLMYGEVPAYRTLAEGIEDGPDVEQLEQNLAALGYEPGTVDEEFSSSTASAISAWQEETGLEATGEVELGRVAFLPGPRRVTQVEATLGEAIGSGSGGNGLVSYEPPIGEAEEAPEEEEPEPQPEKPETEETEEPAPEERTAAPEASASGGGGAEPTDEGESDPSSVPILKTSSTRHIVSVELDPDQQSVAHRGQKVEVLLPGGEEADGKVQRIAVAESSSESPGEESEPGVEVTVSLLGKSKVPALDGAAVSVLFTQNVREDVLSVPLTALVAIGSERFAVVAIEGTARRQIVVTPGLAADGYVEVEGKGLREGMLVETGQ
ncbi:MAG TPA: peptidoglycan-binding domain-containing protein [Solirubrobacterales bacterium]|nr:peptidoglycan-binding domain-containing protein [Solirubrobacterales bacterium]